MKENDHIKRLFNEKLKDFEANVPDSVWSRIDASLSQNSESVFIKKRQSRGRIIKLTTTVASVAAMLALLFLLTNIDESQDMPLKQLVEAKTETEPQKAVEEDAQIQSPIVEELYTQEIISKSRKKPSQQASQRESTTIASQSAIEKTPIEYEDLTIVESQTPKEDEVIIERGKKEKDETIAEAARKIYRQIEDYTEGQHKEKPSRLSLALNSRSNFALLNTVETAQAEKGSYLPQLYTKKEEVEFRHYQPISLGVSVSKEIFRDVRAELGVSYIYAVSRVKAKPNDIFELEDRQVFHYLAVPVSLSYRFAELNKFKFQIAVGGSVQKDFYGLVKGKMEYKDLMPNDKMKKKSELEQENPQFSVSATLGVAYPLYKKLNVYTTVGWAYYLDADNKYQTIYSDRPHQLDLNVGLRYDF